MSIKPISISLSPNVESDDVRLTLGLILLPWKWKKGKAIQELEQVFRNYFNIKYSFSFNSGRSGLTTILKSLNLEKGSKVITQAFTCNAAINPILWSGLKPVYVDCNKDDFNIDVEDLEKTLEKDKEKNIKVVIVQHTFGLPANMNKILEIVEKNNLILIEDCAHSLGAEYNNKKVGTFGKATYFSFSRDKIISSVYGGMVITNNDELAQKIKENQESLNFPNNYWTFQQLLHPILLNFIILPLYNFIDLGKIFLVLSQGLHILSKAVHWKEKIGEQPNYFSRRLPNALALLALNQFKKLERFNNHRQEIASFYYQELKNTNFVLPQIFLERKNTFLRFTIKHPEAHEIIYNSWHRENILLGDWYTSAIAPEDTKIENFFYNSQDCPNAEELSKITLNLPTHINISIDDAKKIIQNLIRK
ncbi:aminotransferase class I/II-fold pyridoxal phosphate-dependent enzyme [Patescibacteria group bacterium]|nr:aminotransferase class I/II-fold pyridoxal phosphate-dependent enzyme [Patescibacteria group bacterium]